MLRFGKSKEERIMENKGFSKENFHVEVDRISPKGRIVGLARVMTGDEVFKYRILSNGDKPDFAVPCSTAKPNGGFEPAFEMPKDRDEIIRRGIMSKWNNPTFD